MRGDVKLYRRGDSPNWWYYFFLDGKVYRGSTETADHKKAEKVLKAKRDELGAARKLHQPIVTERERKTTVGQLLDALEADYRIRGKLNPRFSSHLKAVREPFEHFRAVALREEHIDAWIEKSLRDGYAPGTINLRTQTLRQAFRLGRKRVGTGPDIRHLPVNNARQGFFEKAEFDAIVPHLPDDLRDFARFGYLTGMRKGEIASLKWAQYDRNSKILNLEAQHSKNREARKIPIEDELLEIIERRLQARNYKGPDGETVMSPLIFHRRSRTSRGSDYVMCEGQPIKSFNRAWDSACEAAGIGKRLFHDLRRSAARNMRRAGVAEEVAMKITGHKTNAMFKRYNITDEHDIREALRKEQEYLKSLPSTSNVAQFKKASGQESK